jgi:hypothetical protein
MQSDNEEFLLYISTRSLLGVYNYKVCRPASRSAASWSHPRVLVERYNETVFEQFKIHQIKEHLDAVDRMTRYCGYPSPPWLRSMNIKLYKQMSDIESMQRKTAGKFYGQTVTSAR